MRHFYKNILWVIFTLCLPIVGMSQSTDQQMKLLIRAIGDAFLLQAQDSTTLILPILKTEQGYVMQIDQPILFEPNALSSAVHQVMEQVFFYEELFVETRKCDSPEVVHSFKASLTKAHTLLPCKQRLDQKGCYQFYFTVINTPTTTKSIPKNNTSYSYGLLLVMGVILIVFLRIVFKRQKLKQDTTDTTISIGQYQLNKTTMELVFKAQSMTLTAKETDLLYLLYAHRNTTLDKSFILNAVWGDSGDYVGRTLDVYISKLRKKLALDSRIKIINVRGVGYRLVLT